jgi:hypothetical protein
MRVNTGKITVVRYAFLLPTLCLAVPFSWELGCPGAKQSFENQVRSQTEFGTRVEGHEGRVGTWPEANGLLITAFEQSLGTRVARAPARRPTASLCQPRATPWEPQQKNSQAL